MNLHAIALVQETFALVEPATTAVIFYDRLFVLDPHLRPLFKQEMALQEVRFMAALQVAVGGLSEPEMMVTAVKQLGRRHAGYGVRPEHYHTFGEALLWALERQLGERWTPEMAAAWTEAYYLLAGLMKEAAVLHETKRVEVGDYPATSL
jgi:hemoglobin-like flavoprotein